MEATNHVTHTHTHTDINTLLPSIFPSMMSKYSVLSLANTPAITAALRPGDLDQILVLPYMMCVCVC